MPELPEVETMRRGILGALGGAVVAATRMPCTKRPIEIRPRIDHLNRRMVGSRIDAIDRLGKRVVLVLNTGDRLVIEPRMTGLVLLENAPSQEHLRFLIRLKKCPVRQILFWDRRGLGKITLFSESQYHQKRNDGSLGIDALEIDWRQLAEQLGSSRREIKVALLDQSRVLGIGNLYASEILHLSGVHPQTRCDRIGPRRWQAIQQSIREVLEQAIQYEGSTLSDGTYRNALNQSGTYQNAHRVYARADQLCPSCESTKITRIVQAQRSTFFCRRCQKRR